MSAPQNAFVLKTWPWKETSLLCEALTAQSGRVFFAARGAKRPASALKGLLNPFVPLSIEFAGRAEVKTLRSAKWLGGYLPIEGDALFTGFYANELVLRLLPREDPCPAVFNAYVRLLAVLSAGNGPAGEAVLAFEHALLCNTGYALPAGEGLWVYDSYGMRPYREGESCDPDAVIMDGAVKEAIRKGDFSRPEVKSKARLLFRAMIRHIAGDPPLKTPPVIRALRQI